MASNMAGRPPKKNTANPPIAPATAASAGQSAERTVPLVGRIREQSTLRQLLSDAVVIVVRGEAGVGKSRLVRYVAAQSGVRYLRVKCLPHDTSMAVVARAERALQCGWGQAAIYLSTHTLLLHLDQCHALGQDVLARVTADLSPNPHGQGRLVLTTRTSLTNVGSASSEMIVNGLDAETSIALFDALDARLGPVAVDAEDKELWQTTHGNPQRIIEYFAKKRDATILDSQAYRFCQRLRGELPLSVLAKATQLVDGDKQLAELAASQVIVTDELDQVCGLAEAVDAIDPSTRIASTSEIDLRLATAFSAQLALGTATHSIDALRESVRHSLAGADLQTAMHTLMANQNVRYQRGASWELLALLADCQVAADADGASLPAGLLHMWFELLFASRQIHDVRQLLQKAKRRADAAQHIELFANAQFAVGNFAEVRRLLSASQSSPWSQRVQLALALHTNGAGLPHEALAEQCDIDTALAVLHHDGANAAQLRAAEVMAANFRVVSNASNYLRAATLFAQCLLHQGRLTEAAAFLQDQRTQFVHSEDVQARDEYLAATAQSALRHGKTADAIATLRLLMQQQRLRGDELMSLHTEISLAEVEVSRGHVAAASELATVVRTTATRLGLGPLLARAELVIANVELLEHRAESAQTRLEAIDQDVIGKVFAVQRDAALAIALAFRGQHAPARKWMAELETRSDIDAVTAALACAHISLALGDHGDARDRFTATAALAERHGDKSAMISALAAGARVHLARGDRGAARSCATRAAREASTTEYAHARCQALIALAALARAEDDAASGIVYARDAADLATAVGLPVERFLAYAALDAIAGSDAGADPYSPNAATLSPAALDACNKMLAELGLSAQRPYGLIDAEGNQSEAVDANPEVLQLAKRALAIDGVRESIWRHGQELADLRRRSLLKKLLFLFASAPGAVFTKEAIVSAVWNVEYHPLRHDAALFTNIMRIRRLLGEGGAEIIRVTDDGYRFVPPADFVFVFAR
jgi:DNA-binding response OmpR family regulator